MINGYKKQNKIRKNEWFIDSGEGEQVKIIIFFISYQPTDWTTFSSSMYVSSIDRIRRVSLSKLLQLFHWNLIDNRPESLLFLNAFQFEAWYRSDDFVVLLCFCFLFIHSVKKQRVKLIFSPLLKSNWCILVYFILLDFYHSNDANDYFIQLAIVLDFCFKLINVL